MKEKLNNLKKENLTSGHSGITLIALVITIIVMLILVAVTINMAVNGGLFAHAGNAARDTETEKNKEMELANVSSNLTTDELIDYYTQSVKNITIHNIADDNSFTFKINRNEFDNIDWFPLLFNLLREQYPDQATHGWRSFWFQEFYYDEECSHLAIEFDNEIGYAYFEEKQTFDSFPQNLYIIIND